VVWELFAVARPPVRPAFFFCALARVAMTAPPIARLAMCGLAATPVAPGHAVRENAHPDG
jgi:hypothetical protein